MKITAYKGSDTYLVEATSLELSRLGAPNETFADKYGNSRQPIGVEFKVSEVYEHMRRLKDAHAQAQQGVGFLKSLAEHLEKMVPDMVNPAAVAAIAQEPPPDADQISALRAENRRLRQWLHRIEEAAGTCALHPTTVRPVDEFNAIRDGALNALRGKNAALTPATLRSPDDDPTEAVG